jgi:hypothetical protein
MQKGPTNMPLTAFQSVISTAVWALGSAKPVDDVAASPSRLIDLQRYRHITSFRWI